MADHQPHPPTNGHSHDTKIMNLTPFDQIMLRQITRFLICFRIDQNTQEEVVLDVLRQGLAKTLKQIPFLSGHVRYSGDRNMVSVHFEESKSICLKVSDLRETMPAYEELRSKKVPLSELKENLLSPLPNFIHPDTKSQPILTVQANLLRGGLILCVCVHHSVIDGIGQGLLMTALAANCALASNPADPIAADLSARFDKIKDEIEGREHLFANLKDKDVLLNHDYEEYHIADPSTVSPIDNIVVRPCTARLFMFSDTRLQQLKSAIAGSTPVLGPEKFISTSDALGALAWSCITSARLRTGKLTAQDTSKLVIPICCRKQLELCGLPKPYLGNACICLMPTLPVPDISSTTLSRPSNPVPSSSSESFLSSLLPIAHHIRHSISNLSIPYILGLAHHANGFAGDINTMKPLMQSYLGPDVTYVSWAAFLMHDLYFGKVLGTMDYFRCPYRALDGVVKILPRGKGDEWEVIVEMETDVMECLLEEGGEWMKWVDEVIY